MKFLILGNTAFLGRGLIELAASRGHDVTVLSRTQLDRGRLPDVEWISAAAADDIDRMAGRNFDVVLDLSARDSLTSLRTALTLADRVGLYVLVSSISVYRDFARPGIDETHPTARLPEGVPERAEDFGTFGARLALCELRIAEACPDRALILRMGLLAGPSDCTDRVSRVLARAELGGEMLAGASPRQPVQLLDVRDAAEFALARAEDGRRGLFNVVGEETTLGEVVGAAADAAGADAAPFFADDDFLVRRGLEPMNQLPLWVPRKQFGGFFTVSARAARSVGLAPRPLPETLADALAFQRDQRARGVGLLLPPGTRAPLATLPLAAEQRLIDEYKRLANGRATASAVA